MKVTIEIYTAFDGSNNPKSLSFKRKKDFHSEQEINDYTNHIIASLNEIYEGTDIPFSAKINIDEWKIERDAETTTKP